jgi:SAM-dependent methyltransferase
VEDTEECRFYHTMELPCVGLQRGDWDLRESVDDYLGRADFRGKSVIDVGTASGFLAFEMERRGASVIGFDMTLDDPRIGADLIPYHDLEKRRGASIEQIHAYANLSRRRMRNSFWLSHRLLGSKVRAYYGSIYETPRLDHAVDVAFFGNVLQHLRDPLLALAVFAEVTAQTIIVTETCQVALDYESELPVMWLRANAEEPANTHTWWQLTPGALKQYLAVLGFETASVAFHFARWEAQDRDVRQFTVVAHRPA